MDFRAGFLRTKEGTHNDDDGLWKKVQRSCAADQSPMGRVRRVLSQSGEISYGIS